MHEAAVSSRATIDAWGSFALHIRACASFLEYMEKCPFCIRLIDKQLQRWVVTVMGDLHPRALNAAID